MTLEEMSLLFDDLWKLAVKYHDPQPTDAYWRSLTSAAEAIIEKYKSPFADMLVMVCVMDIEDRDRSQRGEQVDRSQDFEWLTKIYQAIKRRWKA